MGSRLLVSMLATVMWSLALTDADAGQAATAAAPAATASAPAAAPAVVPAAVTLGAPAAGNAKPGKGKDKTPADPYDTLFNQYLQEARAAAVRNAGDSFGWINGLALDRRARQVNDLITIRVVENITASGSADSELAKASSANHAIPGLFGLDKKLPSIIGATPLVSTKSDSQFKGSGTTNRAGVLTALLTARVAEVLPNGDLVVQGTREIEINGDRQTVVLIGVARAADIDQQNTIPSTSIGQLRISYSGRGLTKDYLNPGFLARFLNKVF